MHLWVKCRIRGDAGQWCRGGDNAEAGCFLLSWRWGGGFAEEGTVSERCVM